ncbi:alpha/beta hydrolase family protein [Gloeobacter kilaueensis]|uniref:Peptidase S9 prolyl oligopeptidase active site domain protein n=1 Tax=Gloeobacter kilaueensis (strain ATCC BAA-2537 / CCAP 1431/1 / ULC 316 / JS1) TaxID=1183438 RepID=U5QQK7_GLOK1|nr:S9 family peptidase [Gloeobacter kilaueensis]AGY59970.1 peptidase S9 prolyl oligopeptidase active site domain protein [Gloeobacter kilaueensis JS1]
MGDYTGTKFTAIYVSDVATGQRKRLTPPCAECVYQIGGWSPDGKQLSITSNALNGYNNVALLGVDDGQLQWLTRQDWDALAGGFSPDGQFVALTINEDGSGDGYLYDLRSKKLDKLPLPPGVNDLPGSKWTDVTASAFSPDGEYLMFYHNGPQSPENVWVYDLEHQRASQLTYSLVGAVRSEDMVEPTLVHFPSADGKWKLSAYVYVPHNLQRDRTHPAIVYVHGGPNYQYRNQFGRTVQYLVNQGYVLIVPNYRGSTGYGSRFHDANRFDLGGGDLRDVVSAAQWISQTGYVNPKKLVLMGGSYGGYLTMMGLTKYPNLWAAGVAEVPFVNWFSFKKGTDPAIWEYFALKMGDPVRNRNLWSDRSPINFLSRMKAPLLLISGGKDPRAPVGELRQVVAAGRKLRLPIEWKVYENEGHQTTRVENVVDTYTRIAAFIKRYSPSPSSQSASAR